MIVFLLTVGAGINIHFVRGVLMGLVLSNPEQFGKYHNETILPFPLIYKGKTPRSLPNVDFPDGFSLSHNEKDWSNETETICLVNDVLVSYIKRVKEARRN